MRHSFALRIWLPRLVIPLPLALPVIAIRRPFYDFSSLYGVRAALAVDVRMASYRTDGAFWQVDDGVDLAAVQPPLIDAFCSDLRDKRDLTKYNKERCYQPQPPP